VELARFISISTSTSTSLFLASARDRLLSRGQFLPFYLASLFVELERRRGGARGGGVGLRQERVIWSIHPIVECKLDTAVKV